MCDMRWFFMLIYFLNKDFICNTYEKLNNGLSDILWKINKFISLLFTAWTMISEPFLQDSRKASYNMGTSVASVTGGGGYLLPSDPSARYVIESVTFCVYVPTASWGCVGRYKYHYSFDLQKDKNNSHKRLTPTNLFTRFSLPKTIISVCVCIFFVTFISVDKVAGWTLAR